MGNSAMVVTADIGSDKTIHPPDKTTVAERLLKCALVKTYGVKNIMYEGPVYKSMKIKGPKVILSFDKVGSGIVFKGQDTGNFEVAGTDKIFHKANAKLVGQTIELQSDNQSAPVAVRYAFKNYMQGNLYNKEGLPGVPFRTDRWKP
jgi:sialate O-acetylesterase